MFTALHDHYVNGGETYQPTISPPRCKGITAPVTRCCNPRWQRWSRRPRNRSLERRHGSSRWWNENSFSYLRRLTAEKCMGIQITRSPQVTAWQVLNGDDVETEKKLDPGLTCHPSPRRARRLSWLPVLGSLQLTQTSLWLWIQTSTQFALSEQTFPLTGFNMCPSDSLWNSAHSLCLSSSASSSQLLLFCPFGLCFLSTLWFSIFSLLSSLESHSTVK